MKKSLFLTIVFLIPFLFACHEDADSDFIDESYSYRVSLYPEEIIFQPDGTINNETDILAIVTINPIKIRDINWQASIKDGDWLTINETIVDSDGLSEKGLIIKASLNEEYKRTASIIIKLEDGTEHEFEIVQLGLKADAFINIEDDITALEFMADLFNSQEISFETNMDVYSIEIEDDVNWIEVDDLGDYRIKIIPEANNVLEAPERSAKITIRVGTPNTSEAIAVIEIRQFGPELQSFIWGTALPDFETIDKAPRMNKKEEDVFIINAYFKNGNLLIGHYTNLDKYPQYYLKSEGVLGVIDKPGDKNNNLDIPTIEIDGMRSLEINLSTLEYSLNKISTTNSMTREHFAQYKTKKYIASDGSMKEWMIEHARWDGGAISPKLGSKMVTSAANTGGYSKDAWPQNVMSPYLNPDFEEIENGGNLQGDDTYGRIYAYSEMIFGTPQGGIDSHWNQTYPIGWQIGDVVVDAVGNEVQIDIVNNSVLSGNNEEDEQGNPTLTWQLQGICPYGWHVANAQDWLDLAYAMSEASSGDQYPIDKFDLTYKQFTVQGKGIENMAPWLRNNTYWENSPIADGADEFGFNFYPIGFRYLLQGYQKWNERVQLWVPLLLTDKKVYRINVIINNHAHTYADMRQVDNGNAILPFRCVRNYKK